MKELFVNDKAYKIVKLLGHGKGGYSYLVSEGTTQYVLKQIHHEPCAYYQFGDKITAEKHDYELLENSGIRIPKLLDIDFKNETLLKEYIEGPTIYDLILLDQMKADFILQVEQMCQMLYPLGLNIDYFPTNFVVYDDKIYYIDFECNNYMEQWDFEHWGKKYWSKTPEFIKYVETH